MILNLFKIYQIIMSESIKQQEFINLGKKMGQIEMRDNTFKENFDYLENHYNQNYQNIKIKKEMVYTKTTDFMINHIKENYKSNEEDILNINYVDDEKIKLILLIKFLKLQMTIKDNELKKEIENKEDVQEMNESFIQELDEKDKIIQDLEKENIDLEFYINIFLHYIFPFLFFGYINFLYLYNYGFETFHDTWIQIRIQRYNFLSLYLIYLTFKKNFNVKLLIPITLFTIITNYYPIEQIDNIFNTIYNICFYNNYLYYVTGICTIGYAIYKYYNYKTKID